MKKAESKLSKLKMPPIVGFNRGFYTEGGIDYFLKSFVPLLITVTHEDSKGIVDIKAFPSTNNIITFVITYDSFEGIKSAILRLIIFPKGCNFTQTAELYKSLQKISHTNIEKFSFLLEGKKENIPNTDTEYCAYFVSKHMEHLGALLPKLNFLERLEVLIEVGKAFSCLCKKGIILKNFGLENIFLETYYDPQNTQREKMRVLLGNFDFIDNGANVIANDYIACIDKEILQSGKKKLQQIYKHVFGMLMWKVITDKNPFENMERQAVIKAIKEGKLPYDYDEHALDKFFSEITSYTNKQQCSFFIYAVQSCWEDGDKLDEVLNAVVLIRNIFVQHFKAEIKPSEPVAKDSAQPVDDGSAAAAPCEISTTAPKGYWGVSPSRFERSKEYLKHASRIYSASSAGFFNAELTHKPMHGRQNSRISMSIEELYVCERATQVDVEMDKAAISTSAPSADFQGGAQHVSKHRRIPGGALPVLLSTSAPSGNFLASYSDSQAPSELFSSTVVGKPISFFDPALTYLPSKLSQVIYDDRDSSTEQQMAPQQSQQPIEPKPATPLAVAGRSKSFCC